MLDSKESLLDKNTSEMGCFCRRTQRSPHGQQRVTIGHWPQTGPEKMDNTLRTEEEAHRELSSETTPLELEAFPLDASRSFLMYIPFLVSRTYFFIE